MPDERPRLSELYVGPDPQGRTGWCAGWRVPAAGGAHEVVAQDFRSRSEAERWLVVNYGSGR